MNESNLKKIFVELNMNLLHKQNCCKGHRIKLRCERFHSDIIFRKLFFYKKKYLKYTKIFITKYI